MSTPDFSSPPTTHDAAEGRQNRRTARGASVHPVEAPTARADAARFVRSFRPESLSLLGAESEDAAVSELLALRVHPLEDEEGTAHRTRRTSYDEDAKEQGVPALGASLLVSVALFLAVVAGALAALVAVWRALGLPAAQDHPLLAPEHLEVLRAFEIAALAPTLLVPPYLVFIATVHWRARTHGRAILRVALADRSALTRGIPVRSPWHGIWSSWAFLATCLQYLLYGYLAVALIAWWDGHRSTALVVLAYAVPVVLIQVVVHRRAKVWKRRDQLLDAQLYRDTDSEWADVETAVDEPEPPEDSDDPIDAEEGAETSASHRGSPERTEWRSDFSAPPGSADDRVDRGR